MKKEAELQKACKDWFDNNTKFAKFKRERIEIVNGKPKKHIISLLVASANGGSRDGREGKNLKKQGVRSGFPDLQLLIANESKNGLFIELKQGTNKLTLNQKIYFDLLIENGYQVEEVRSFDQFRIIIERYLLFLSDK